MILDKKNLTQVEDWYTAPIDSTNYLDELFTDALDANNIFRNIYVAIRSNPESDAQEENPTYTYENVGVTISQLTDYFNTKYSANYFLYDYKIESDYNKLLTRIKSIYLANFYKYKKLIELMGYRYNPLYNVDANELYSNMESYGDNQSTRSPSGTIRSTSGTLDTNDKIGISTTTNYTNPYDQNTSQSADYVSDKTEQSAITTEQSYNQYSETTSLKNDPAQNFVIDPQTGTISKSGLFSVAAKDSAFGVSLGGAERYYAEKRIRQGNIGITKSTELIDSQRQTVKFNILDEFFRDLEKDIIVGIF